MTGVTSAGVPRTVSPDDGSARSLTVPYRVRFDESTPAGDVRASALLRYAQDCAWVHSERLGFGREWYAARGRYWLVRAVELTVGASAPTGAVLGVTTSILGFRRVWARRRTTVTDPTGGVLATVDTDWVMTDERGAPARVPEEFIRLLGAAGERFEPHRVSLPATPPDADSTRFVVRRQELDPMGHANNGAFLDWVEEAVAGLADGRDRLVASPRTYRLEYLLPAPPGSEVEAAAWPIPQADGTDEPDGTGHERRTAVRLTIGGGEALRATVTG